MNKKLLRFFGVLSLLCVQLFLSPKTAAQNYPVQANLQLLPPYSVYLSDYVAPGSEKFMATLLLKDLNEQSYNIRLHISIEGVGIKIETSRDFKPMPITINGGIQERIGASELSPYFDANNLIFQGLTKQQYQKNAALPEGFYKFCIQAFDYNTNHPVSDKACFSAWLILNDPPRIVTPVCGNKVRVIYPQNLVFQWVPMHMNSPNTALNTEYHFRLVQVIPAGRNPNDAILSSVPIFEAITDNTTLYYGISEPALIPGQQYAWRVRAKDKGGKDLFKNNGYSETCFFTYGDGCKSPDNISVQVESSQRVKIDWETVTGATRYIIRYRIKEEGSEWFMDEAYVNSRAISNLKPSSLYEFQIQSICDPVVSDYSPVDTFRTVSPPEVNDCSVPFNQDSSISKIPLIALFTGDAINVDGFNIRVTETNGANGNFSGKGVAYVPFLNAYILTAFNNIKINENYQVYEGKVVALKASLTRYH
ncbi:MAG TPA: fibronectin type III domain-containing protein, partial [Cytophagaceae bacterium]